jgi:hypothetical protein
MTAQTSMTPGARHLRRGAAMGLLLGTAIAIGACGTGMATDHLATRAGVGSGGGQGAIDGVGWARSGGAGRTTSDDGWTGGGAGVGSGGAYGGNGRGYEDGETSSGDVADRVADYPLATLTQAEIDGLVHMREEEKLAHDVYVALADAWGSRVFENIARSETVHADAVKTLLDRYGIADPAAGMAAGSFTDPGLQQLYDELVARGRTSLTEAFTVGALIEDLDIADLRERSTATPDLAVVYADLESGSENHLRAFTRNLARTGATYTPTYLDQDAYDEIVGSSSTPGRSS